MGWMTMVAMNAIYHGTHIAWLRFILHPLETLGILVQDLPSKARLQVLSSWISDT